VTASAGWIRTYILLSLVETVTRVDRDQTPELLLRADLCSKKLFECWTLYGDPERCRSKKPRLCKSSEYPQPDGKPHPNRKEPPRQRDRSSVRTSNTLKI
jgi:hypothetical protein